MVAGIRPVSTGVLVAVSLVGSNRVKPEIIDPDEEAVEDAEAPALTPISEVAAAQDAGSTAERLPVNECTVLALRHMELA